MIDTYAVLGSSVAHSKSPFIHTEFAKQTQQQITYRAISVPLEQFIATVQSFQAAQGKGLNITTPFKQLAFELVTHCSQRARIAKSVNTIKFLADGSSFGDTTDGVGLIRDLTEHHHYTINHRNILIIGAGGAVRAILAPLLAQKPAKIVVVNRTLVNAENLAKEFQPYGNIYALPITMVNDQGGFDLIINGTSAATPSVNFPLNANLLLPTTFCYDLTYGQNLTSFLQWAQQCGVTRLSDGIGMLIEQAAESFYLWRGIKPDTRKIFDLFSATKPAQQLF